MLKNVKSLMKSAIKTKIFRNWLFSTLALLALLLAAIITVTAVSPVYNSICRAVGGERRVLVSGNPDLYMRYEAETTTKNEAGVVGASLNQKICEEGVVLLKNNNSALPLATNSKVTVFGKNSGNLVIGGSGSSSGGRGKILSLCEGLLHAEFLCNPVMQNFYRQSASGAGRPSNPGIGSVLTGFPVGETPASDYTDEVIKSWDDYSDAAIVVLSRIAGEGFDLPRTMFWNGKSYVDPEWSGTQVIPGAESATSHYLELDKNEKDMIDLACDNFDKVIVLINSAAPIECGFLKDSKIDAALWIGYLGANGADAIGSILCGDISPSGRTVDTFAVDFTKDPTWNNFGNNLVADGNRYMTSEGGLQARNAWFVEYREGIYSGYRYYETRGYTEQLAGNAGWYSENVVYPFGYGLSYTQFSWEVTDCRVTAENIEVDVKVTNTGDYAGKDVIELYFTPPYVNGGIEKPHVVLADFVKTDMLQPGSGDRSSETYTLSCNIRDMASYDYSDANRNGFSGYELEGGNYILRIMRNSHDEEWSSSISLEGQRYYAGEAEKTQLNNLFEESNLHNIGKWEYLSRSDWNGTWPQPVTESDRTVSEDFIDGLTYKLSDDAADPWYEQSLSETDKENLKGGLKLYDLIGKDVSDPAWDELVSTLSAEQLIALVCGADYGTVALDEIGKPRTIEADGPEGFVDSIGNAEIYGECYYACECVMGATWNTELIYEFGKAIGDEALHGDERGNGTPYSGWYAPAANIHRSPFGGRNWEYYSEDALLSGKMAAAAVKGAASKGVTAYVKHFALNDQETNRDNTGLVTWANEQAMREIYFRPFEIAVKEGGARGIMSSFNRIGSEWTGGSYALLTSLLREEWGFEGAVITDYNSKFYMNTDQMIRAGGDMSLGPGIKQLSDVTSATAVSNLRRAAKNILYVTANGNALNGMGAGVVYRYALPYWVIWLIVAYIAVFILCMGYGVYILVGLSKEENK